LRTGFEHQPDLPKGYSEFHEPLCNKQTKEWDSWNSSFRTGALDFRGSPLNNLDVARIVIEHLSKFFSGPRGENIRAVDDLSLTVEDGELLTVVGPSGCGKTTTLRLLSGLEEPSAGTITMDGQLMNGVEPKERDVAMVFQNPALYPHMTARENIGFGLQLRKCPRAELERRLQEAAELLNLTDCLDRRPAELSGGQCQRVALGRAIVRRPKVFLFDEPLSNLDPRSRSQLRAEILRLHKKLSATAVYVTHDQAEATMLGQRIAVMNEGRIQQVATPRELHRYPGNVFVAGFIGSPGMNFFEGILVPQGEFLRFEEQNSASEAAFQPLKVRCPKQWAKALKGYLGKSIRLGVRAEDTRYLPDLQASGASDGEIDGLVEFLEPTGGEIYLHLLRGGSPLVARTAGAESALAGQKVRLHVDLERAHCFDATTGNAIRCES
jgi:multiple sugar transport system ATP-binding protein